MDMCHFEGLIMKRVINFSLLILALLLVGCNEKVSPELQDSNASTPDDDGGTVTPTEYYFKITDTSKEILNYKLHKTGPGNANTECKVSGTAKFSSDNYRGSPSVYDITCFLEAEELSLKAGGFSFKIESSPNTCDFVSYHPFSYYNRPPGDSTGTYTQISCMNDDTNTAHVDAAAALAGVNIEYDLDGDGPGVATGPASCDAWLSKSPLLASTRQPFTPESDAELCRFNYTDGDEEKCDIGTITVQNLQVTFDATKAAAAADTAAKIAGEAAGDAAGVAAGAAARTAQNTADITKYTTVGAPQDAYDDGLATISTAEQAQITANGQEAYNSAYATAYAAAYTPAYNLEYDAVYAAYPPTYRTVVRTVKCGGSAYNCVDGPIKRHGEISTPRGGILHTPTKNQTFSTTYDYPHILDRAGNYVYANFRRDLATAEIQYGTSEHDHLSDPVIPYNNTYLASWSDAIFGKIFDALVMERYSRNLAYDGVRNLSTTFDGNPAPTLTTWETYSTQENKYTAKPLAAEPFLGMGNLYYTNPYYAINCLDTGKELKARIRLIVRDWDRVYPNNANIEYLSDLFLGDNARQDLQHYVEDTASDGDDNEMNDILDWDDIIMMEKDDAVPLVPVFRPYPYGIYNDGFFNPGYYPQESR
jgi:hypothetical protein